MPRRNALGLCFGLLLALSEGLGCSGPRTEIVEIGHHRVRLAVPNGWEHLDHGRQQLFRSGESQISLVDLGPATREAMARELREAESLWREGHHQDAFQRVRQLRSPVLRFAARQQRADFWNPWNNVSYPPEPADSMAIGTAFGALILGTELLAEVTPEQMLEYVPAFASDMRRREIRSRDRRTIGDADWIDVETWDHVSHLNRSRVAFLVNNGYLLVLAIDGGSFENANPGFEALLSSIEAMAHDPPSR